MRKTRAEEIENEELSPRKKTEEEAATKKGINRRISKKNINNENEESYLVNVTNTPCSDHKKSKGNLDKKHSTEDTDTGSYDDENRVHSARQKNSSELSSEGQTENSLETLTDQVQISYGKAEQTVLALRAELQKKKKSTNSNKKTP